MSKLIETRGITVLEGDSGRYQIRNTYLAGIHPEVVNVPKPDGTLEKIGYTTQVIGKKGDIETVWTTWGPRANLDAITLGFLIHNPVSGRINLVHLEHDYPPAPYFYQLI